MAVTITEGTEAGGRRALDIADAASETTLGELLAAAESVITDGAVNISGVTITGANFNLTLDKDTSSISTFDGKLVVDDCTTVADWTAGAGATNLVQATASTIAFTLDQVASASITLAPENLGLMDWINDNCVIRFKCADIDYLYGLKARIGQSASKYREYTFSFVTTDADWQEVTGFLTDGSSYLEDVKYVEIIADADNVQTFTIEIDRIYFIRKSNGDVIYSLENIPKPCKLTDTLGTVIEPAKEDGNLATLAAVDFATQTTLDAVLSKIIAAPATEAKQDTGNGHLATLSAVDFATQTTLSALNGKVTAVDTQNVRLKDPQIGRAMRVSPGSGALVSDQTTRLVGAMFRGSTLDTNFWTVANNGTGSASALSNAVVTVTSGTANSGYGSLVSVRHGRFLFVNPNLFRQAARLTATTAVKTTRIIGAMDITAGNPPTLNNGFYFAYNENGVLSVNRKVTGQAAVSVSSGSFNGDVASFTADTNVHAYEILYFVMGAWFFIDGVLIHKFTPTTGVLSDDLDLHCFAMAVNDADGTTSASMEVWASSILRMGKEVTRPAYARATSNSANAVVLKRSAGAIHQININKAGSSNNLLTLYDSTTIDSNKTIGIFDTNTSREISFGAFGLDFQDGLCYVLNTGTAADATIIYD